MRHPPLKKHIALILSKLQMGGLEKVVLQLAESFNQMGHQVDIFFFESKNYFTPPVLMKASVGFYPIKIKKTFKRCLWYCQYRVKKTLQAQEHAHQCPYDMILGNLIQESAYLHQLPQNHCFYIIHECLSYWIGKLRVLSDRNAQHKLKKLQKAFYHKHLITVSKGVEEDVLKTLKLHPKSVRTLYNPFDIHQIQALAEEEISIPATPYLIHIARFEPHRKNQPLLLQAFQKIPAPYRLLLLTEDSPQLRTLIHSIDHTHRIDIIGFQANPYPWLKHAKLSLLSSNSEGFGNVILESLIVGTPVVSTDCQAGPREILTGPLAHWLTPVGDADAFASKIIEALHAHIDIPEDNIQRFDAHRIAQQYLALI